MAAALGLVSDGGDTKTPSAAAGVAAEETAASVAKTPRLPRWTRQEILVLIEGKRVVENRVRRGRVSFGAGQLEPKWASVSSYCKRHGVNRGPVQCRKRWSNLAGDYKKIKEWERGIKEESESFWVMRNDLRRERRLPGFFDCEVYDILKGDSQVAGLALALALGPALELEAADAETVLDSGRSSAAGAEDELFSGEEDETPLPLPTGVDAPVPISEKAYQPLSSPGHGGGNEKEPIPHQKGGCSSHDVRKRKRNSVEDWDAETGTLSLHDKLIDVLEKNSKMLHSQLQVQNNNLQLDREQRKHNAASLVEVLNKMAGAMVKIAEKL